MGYVLGVDLGTTFTAAAVRRGDRVEVATLGAGDAAIPSVVFLGADGSIIVGEPARRRALAEPGRVAREFKRRFGDPTPLLVGGAPMSADVLTGRLLGAVVRLIAEREGGPPDAVGVTHPANWGPYKIDLLHNACRVAGLDHVVLVPEPVAAATQYAASDGLAQGATVAVYDLGGGTFDAAVLRHDGDSFTILGRPEGIERIGGIDFDAAIVGHVDSVLGGALRALDLDDPDAAGAAARVQRECVEAKEALSDDTSASIGVYLPGRTDQVRITRDELEQRIRPALQETVAALRRALASADLTPADVDRVLLVGGSSRIPLVAELVGAELGRPVSVNAHPKHTTALGAARLAGAGVAAAPAAVATAASAPVRVAALATTPGAPPGAVPAASPAAVHGAPPPAPPASAPPPPPRIPSEPPSAPAATAARSTRHGPRRGRKPILIGVVALLIAAAAAGAVIVATSGDDETTTTTTAGAALLAFDAARDAAGVCTAAWEFSGTFEQGDQLRLLWRGTPVAEGNASNSGELSSTTGFDELQLVRSGRTVQAWSPAGEGC